MPNELAAMERAQGALVEMAMKFGPKLVVAILIILVGFYAGRWVGAGFDRWLAKIQLEIPVRILLVRIARLLVLALFMIMALQNLGVDLLPLVAGLGVAGAGIALAMQGVLGNLAAGLTIIFTRPYRIGDYVGVSGVEGQVNAIDLFTTKLSHPDLSEVVIPNRKIVGEILHNYGQIRQLDLGVTILRGSDLDRTLACIKETVDSDQLVLKDPVPLIGVKELADRSISIAVRPWVRVADYGAASAQINRAMVEAIRGAGVDYPPTARDIRIINS